MTRAWPARSFDIVLDVKPFGKQRARVTRHGSFTPKQTVHAESEIRWLLKKANPPKFEGPLYMFVKAYFLRPKSAPKSRVYPSVKPDIDNVVKLVKDAAESILYENDSQICTLTAIKVYADTECIELCVGKLGCEPAS